MVPFGHFIIPSKAKNYFSWNQCLKELQQVGLLFTTALATGILGNVFLYSSKMAKISLTETTEFINFNCILKIIVNFSEGSIDVKFDTVYSNDDLNSDQIEGAIKNSLSGTNQLAGSTYQVDPDSIGVSGWLHRGRCSY